MSVGQHDFTALKNEYQQVIDGLPDEFTSHEFIRALAQQQQRLYIDALYTYRTTLGPKDSPFRAVHSRLSQMLYDFADYSGHVPSADIFGTLGDCAKWKKRP